MIDREDEEGGDDGAHDVARDHDVLAVEAVEDDARRRADQHRRDGPRQHHAADDKARMRRPDGEAEHRDVVEVVADLADDLADPEVAVVGVAAEKVEEGVQTSI